LLGSTLGAVIGLGYYSNQVHPAEYAATAELGTENPRRNL